MNNYTNFNQNSAPAYQPYYAQQYFLQPQGGIYMIESSNDVANVPVGAGVSAAICLRESTLYLKTFQNGSPMLMIYKLSPIESNNSNSVVTNENSETEIEKKLVSILNEYNARLEKIENQLVSGAKTNKGGVTEWPI